MRRVGVVLGALSACLIAGAVAWVISKDRTPLQQSGAAESQQVNRAKKRNQLQAFLLEREHGWVEGPMPARLAWRLNVNGFRSNILLQGQSGYQEVKFRKRLGAAVDSSNLQDFFADVGRSAWID